MSVAGIALTSCTEKFDPTYLENQIKDLESRVEAVEKNLTGINQSISALDGIVKAMQKNVYVVSVEPAEKGFRLTFSDGSTSQVNLAQGSSSAPQIGVKEIDGTMYWTIDGEFLTDAEGNMVPAAAKDAEAPVIGVKEENGTLYWTVNGEYLLGPDGQRVVASYPEQQGGAGDSVFKSVSVEDGVVRIALQDGTSFIIPMKAPASLRLEANKLHFGYSETRMVHIGLSNILGITVTEKPDGWRAKVNGCSLEIMAPASGASCERDGFVTLLATSGDQTFISKVRVTLDAPVFEMTVTPSGKMTLTELDIDFNMPGFIAGFCAAEDFDPAAVVEPAKGYTPAAGDGIYTSFEGKTFEMSISDSMQPVPGKLYAAYCYPGFYSKWIGVDPDPSDVVVRYFTYVRENYTVSAKGVDKATIGISFDGADLFYGGIIRYFDESELPQLRKEFLADAAAPLEGLGDGMRGGMMDSYSGSLSLFAAPDDGEGKKNARTVTPGGRYALAFIPKDASRVYGEYTIDDVILESLVLNAPQETSSELTTVKAGESTTTSAKALFSIASSVSKFYYAMVTEEELGESGMSPYDYALRHGWVWDRAILKASGAIDNIDISRTGIRPGTKCVAIGVAFTSGGSYYMATLETSSSEVNLSSETLVIKGHSMERISQNSAKISFEMECSSGIGKVRYIDSLTAAEFESEYGGSEDNVFDVLTAGSRWSYDEVDAGNSIDMYVYPEAVDYILFAVGVDAEGRFTKLARYTFQPVE